jgi:hypothetical protein
MADGAAATTDAAITVVTVAATMAVTVTTAEADTVDKADGMVVTDIEAAMWPAATEAEASMAATEVEA